MVKNLGFNFEGIRRLQALLPCWNLLPCKKSERNACSAFKDNSKPCWMLKDAHCSLQGNECRLCDIYRFGSLNSEYIKEFLYDHNSRGDRTEILRNIQQKINKRE
jgi:hypothetical protein